MVLAVAVSGLLYSCGDKPNESIDPMQRLNREISPDIENNAGDVVILPPTLHQTRITAM